MPHFILKASYKTKTKLTFCSSSIWSCVVCTSLSVKNEKKKKQFSPFKHFTNERSVQNFEFTCLCLRMPIMVITMSKMKTTTPLLMATQSQTSTGAFSVKQCIDSVTHFIAHVSLSPSFLHFSYQSLMIAQHMSASFRF